MGESKAQSTYDLELDEDETTEEWDLTIGWELHSDPNVSDQDEDAASSSEFLILGPEISPDDGFESHAAAVGVNGTDQNNTPDTSSDPYTDRCSWIRSPDHTKFLIEKLLSLRRSRKARTTSTGKLSFPSTSLETVANSFHDIFGLCFTVAQLRARISALRVEHAVYLKIRRSGQFKWDHRRHRFKAPLVTWYVFFRDEDIHKRYFQKPFLFHKELNKLFSSRK